jgi:hypothetical protein
VPLVTGLRGVDTGTRGSGVGRTKADVEGFLASRSLSTAGCVIAGASCCKEIAFVEAFFVNAGSLVGSLEAGRGRPDGFDATCVGSMSNALAAYTKIPR